MPSRSSASSGMPRQQVIRGGGRLESKSKGPGAGPGPSEVAYRNLPLSDDGRRGLALADARPAARDAQKSQHSLPLLKRSSSWGVPLSHDRGSLACNPALTSAERTHLHEIRRDRASRQITAAPLGRWRRGRRSKRATATRGRPSAQSRRVVREWVMLSQTVKCEAWSRSEARSYGEPARPRVDQATVQLLAALMWARRARAFSSEISQAVNQYSSPSSAMAAKASGRSQFPTPRLFKCITARSVRNYSVQSPVL